ncbi:hypothetical protein HYX14_02585 [Candidatus Woesearchaeota archaeon]|nr:hypothetical protein [Candidatus Woesearchaeota archaeon]
MALKKTLATIALALSTVGCFPEDRYRPSEQEEKGKLKDTYEITNASPQPETTPELLARPDLVNSDFPFETESRDQDNYSVFDFKEIDTSAYISETKDQVADSYSSPDSQKIDTVIMEVSEVDTAYDSSAPDKSSPDLAVFDTKDTDLTVPDIKDTNLSDLLDIVPDKVQEAITEPKKDIIEVADSEPSPPPCYQNNFSTEADLSDLVTQSGIWSFDPNGYLKVTPTGSSGMIAYLNTPEWADFQASIDVKLVSPGTTHAIHFFFRYTPNGNPPNNTGYTLWLGNWPGQCMSSGECSSGNSLYFNAIDYANEGLYFVPFIGEMGQWHTLGVKAYGNQITAMLDGKEEFTVTDTINTSGKFGFATVNTEGYFKNLKVCPPD